MKRIILTGGGTAGHVTPNIALLPRLRELQYDIHYIGSYNGMEKQLVEQQGIPYHGISSGKLRRYFSLQNFTDPFRVLKGFSEANRLIKQLKPDVIFSKGGFVSGSQEKKMVEKYFKDLKVVAPDMNKVCKFLSGGNQQKVVLAKWLASECKILFLDEPTRGIDVGAKYEIYLLMDKLVQEGVSIVMISSEMPELMGMADRILVMHEGTITGELHAQEFSEENVMKLASGEKLA